jgi:tetratricopeptide (TPR) repeat protein
VRQPDNADIENYLGYAHRNLKQFDAAFKHYKQALVLNPRHRGAHEYIGEAYLMVKIFRTRGTSIWRRCATSVCCPAKELTDLEKAVAAYRLKNARK